MKVAQRLLSFFDGDVAPPHQRFNVKLTNAAPVANRLVHERLRVARIVALVVAVAAVADHVNDNVFMKALAIVPRKPSNFHAGLRVVTINVKDWCLDRLRNVGAVDRRSSELRCRGEADLVVNNEVNRATYPVSADVAHRQTLSNDALASEGCVAVNEQWQHGIRTWRIDLVLLSASHPHHDRVDGLKMARVGGKLHRNVSARTADVLALDAEVILDVARPLHRRRVKMALKFGEDSLVVLAHNVRQHVESTAVRHSHHY